MTYSLDDNNVIIYREKCELVPQQECRWGLLGGEIFFTTEIFYFNGIIFLFLRNVPKQSCQTVPDRQCRTVSITWHIWHTWHTWHIWLLTHLTWLIVQVPKQECRNEPRQTCKTVQRRECQTVPETQCRKGGFRPLSDHWKLNIIGKNVLWSS